MIMTLIRVWIKLLITLQGCLRHISLCPPHYYYLLDFQNLLGPCSALQCTHILDISGLDAVSGKFLQIGTVDSVQIYLYVSKLGVCYMELPLVLIEK